MRRHLCHNGALMARLDFDRVKAMSKQTPSKPVTRAHKKVPDAGKTVENRDDRRAAALRDNLKRRKVRPIGRKIEEKADSGAQ